MPVPRAMAEVKVEAGASCPDLRVNYEVDLQELEVLEFIQKYRRAKRPQIGRAIGLSPTNASMTLNALIDHGLVRTNGVSIDEYTLTFDGVALVRRRVDKS